MSSPEADSLTSTYLELRDDGSVEAIPLTPEFWPDLMAGKRRLEGRLVMAFEATTDMTHWEKHPAGDEVLLVLSGAVRLLLQEPAGEREIAVTAGQAAVIPRGCWHRIAVHKRGQVALMTAGEGTEHKPVAPDSPLGHSESDPK